MTEPWSKQTALRRITKEKGAISDEKLEFSVAKRA